MNCPEIRRLIEPHLDEELDVVNDAAVAAHLENCPACAEFALVFTEQRRLLQEKLTRHGAPTGLAAQIRAALPVTENGSRGGQFAIWRRMAMPMAAGLALAALAGNWWGAQAARKEILVDELTSAHVRARLAGHVIDVESSDRHTVKPWFAGRVDFAPFVPDLAAEGFPLEGGRLERAGGRTIATLIYGRRKHSIDLNVWSGPPEPANGAAVHDGYSVMGWRAGGLNYTAVSDIAPDELAGFASLIQAAK